MLAQTQIQRVYKTVQTLLNNGCPESFLLFAILQIAHETAGFTSNVMETCNNLSGIKYIGLPKQKSAVKCTNSPEGNNYARFENYNAWAVDYLRILKIGVKPIESNSINEFAQKLKQNGYYTDTVENYTTALNSWLPQLQPIVIEAKKKAL